MALAAAGDNTAFGALVARHQVAVRRLCFFILSDDALARDTAQEAFLRLWDARERYRPMGRFRELLFTTARNLAVRGARARSIVAFFDFSAEPPRAGRAALTVPSGDGPPPAAWPSAGVAADAALSDAQRTALVRAALQRLPEKFRVPLLLRFVEELSYEAIASVIGRTPSAARSRVHHGLKALGELVPEEVHP